MPWGRIRDPRSARPVERHESLRLLGYSIYLPHRTGRMKPQTAPKTPDATRAPAFACYNVFDATNAIAANRQFLADAVGYGSMN